jgi:hypothetical protein
MKAYLLRVVIQLDILLMTLANGKRNETLSAAAFSLEADGKWQGRVFRPLIDALMAALGDGPDHCQRTWQKENPIFKG